MPWRTVRGNVEVLAELHNLPRDERQRLGQHAIDLVGLNGFEDHYPKSLSGGMRMRCSLARTLTLRPPIMMFDEPFGAVDEITREHLNEETLRLFEQEGFAGLFITHSISEAVFMSTRVLVMSARPGRIVADYQVPFPYPRDPEIRFDPEFAALSGELSRRPARGPRVSVPDPTDAALAASPVVIESPTVRVDPTKSRARRLAEVVIPPLVLVAVLIGVWYFLSYRVVEAPLPPAPAPRRHPGGLPDVGEPARDPRRPLVHARRSPRSAWRSRSCSASPSRS